MAEYQISEETTQGDLIVLIDGAPQRLVARRETPGSVSVPIRLDGTLLPDGRFQVSCIKYRWPDGYEKWGHYLGSIHTLEAAEQAAAAAQEEAESATTGDKSP